MLKWHRTYCIGVVCVVAMRDKKEMAYFDKSISGTVLTQMKIAGVKLLTLMILKSKAHTVVKETTRAVLQLYYAWYCSA